MVHQKYLCTCRINRELLDCLKVEEAGFTSVPFASIDDKMKVSIGTCTCTVYLMVTSMSNMATLCSNV